MIEKSNRKEVELSLLSIWATCRNPQLIHTIISAIGIPRRMVAIADVMVYKHVLLPSIKSDAFPVQKARETVDWAINVIKEADTDQLWEVNGKYAVMYVDHMIRGMNFDPITNGMMSARSSDSGKFNDEACQMYRQCIRDDALRAIIASRTDGEIDALAEKLSSMTGVENKVINPHDVN